MRASVRVGGTGPVRAALGRCRQVEESADGDFDALLDTFGTQTFTVTQAGRCRTAAGACGGRYGAASTGGLGAGQRHHAGAAGVDLVVVVAHA